MTVYGTFHESSVGSSILLGTLPESFRPIFSSVFNALTCDDTTKRESAVFVRSDGKVEVFTSGVTDSMYKCHMMWLTKTI